MPRTYHPWILTKAKEFSPTGTLQVGQILVEPFNPAYTLMPGGPLPIPADVLQEKSFQTSADLESKEDLNAMFGLWITAAGLPAGGKAGASVNQLDELSWHFEKLSGNIISPSIVYLNAALRHGDVPSYTGRFHVIKRLYMVTGVRIAHGARMVKKSSQSIGLGGEAKSGATGPVDVGAMGRLEKGKEVKENFSNASDFVYAYRLSEVNYWGEPTHKPFVKGEAAGEDAGGDSEDEDVELEPHAGGLKDDFDGQGLDGIQSSALASQLHADVKYQISWVVDSTTD
jgi:hypothetical protein